MTSRTGSDLWAVVARRWPTTPPSALRSSLSLTRPAAASQVPTAHYAVSAVESDGRINDRSAVRALGWERGVGVRFVVHPDAIVVVRDNDAPTRLTQFGHLRLPTSVRRVSGLVPVDRLMLVALIEDGVLLLLAPQTVDAMVATYVARAGVASNGHAA